MNFADNARGDENLTNSEVEEMDATRSMLNEAFHMPSDEDWDFFHEVSYSDPFDTISAL